MTSEEDRFKPIFKYYKSRDPPPSLDGVLSFSRKHSNKESASFLLSQECGFGLKDPRHWAPASRLDSGLVLQPDPFTDEGKMKLAEACLRDYTICPPNRTNISDPQPWLSRRECPSLYKSQLRWATLGYHHNWDTKEYDLTQGDAMPQALVELSAFLVQKLSQQQDNIHFKAQASIVNFYPPQSTLSAHTDHSEPNVSAPLLSISLGLSAIFLIGGRTKAIEPKALCLRHGDVLLMSGESRLCYHAVPRILKDTAPVIVDSGESGFVEEYLRTHRININIRQVL